MANNRKTIRDDTWKERIKTSMLINRLNQNAFGEIELTSSQLKSIEILLRKVAPDLKAVEMSGKDGEAIEVKHISEADQVILDRFKQDIINQSKGK